MDGYDLGLCRGLIAAGCQVSYYTCDETVLTDMPGLRFYPVFRGIYGASHPLIRAARYVVGALKAYARIVREHDTMCHLHVFHGSMTELFLIALAKLCGKKVVLTVHDVETFAGPGGPSRTIISKAYQAADWLIVHNEVSKAELIETLGVSVNKISVVPHGNFLHTLDIIPDREEARNSLEIERSARVILFFGHIKQVKGLDLLLEAMPSVVSAVPAAMLLIAGRPWKSDFLVYEAQMARLGIESYCRCHIGFVADDHVATYFAAAELVVLPYRRIYQSGVILQAMSYSKAVVVSDLPGMTEIVRDRVNGYTFPSADIQKLSEAIIRALSNDAERSLMAANGLEYIRRYHDWYQIGKATANIYRAVLAS